MTESVASINRQMLETFARKYIWWESASEAVATPERVIAQVMSIGDYADVQRIATQVGDDVLRRVLTQAEAGQFDERSWAYWHYRLGLAELGHVPDLPTRSLA